MVSTWSCPERLLVVRDNLVYILKYTQVQARDQAEITTATYVQSVTSQTGIALSLS